MVYNKIIANNQTVLDISEDTVDSDKVLKDISFHKNSGEKANGTIETYAGDTNVTENKVLPTAGTYLNSDITINVSGAGGVDRLQWKCDNIRSLAFEFQGMSQEAATEFTKVMKGLDTSNVTDMSNTFSSSFFETIDVSFLNTSNVVSMDGTFQQGSMLTSLDLSAWDTSALVYMDYIFNNCYELQSINLTHFNTKNVQRMEQIFNGCSKLTSLDLSSFDTSKVTSMNSMFGSCNALTNLNVSSFDTSKVTSMDSMFVGCESLQSLDISNFIYDNISASGTSIGMFIAKASELKSLKLGASIPPIDSNMLIDCPHYMASEANDGKILVPKGMLDAYKTATNWVNFAQYMEEYDLPETTYTFVTTGGTPVEPLTTTGAIVTAPVTTPDDSSKSFTGWYLDDSFVNKVTFPYANMKGGNVTLYAKYSLPNPSTQALAQTIKQSDIGATVFTGELLENNERPTGANNQWPSCWYKFIPEISGAYYIGGYENANVTDMNVVIYKEENGLVNYLSEYNEYGMQHSAQTYDAGITYYLAIAAWSGQVNKELSFKMFKND